MNNSSTTLSSQNSKIKYLTPSPFVNYRMYKQIVHDSILSEESSDIGLTQLSNFDTTLKSASEEISAVSLYDDVPSNLLKQPPHTHPQQISLLYGHPQQFTLFDSVVIDADLSDLQIQQMRKNKLLSQQVIKLYRQRDSKLKKLKQIKSRKTAQIKFKQQLNNIYEKLDLKTERLNTYFDSTKWLQKPDQSFKSRAFVLNLIEDQLSKKTIKIQTKLEDLKIKKQNLIKKIQKLQLMIQQMDEEQFERKMNEKIVKVGNRALKQQKQIESLKRSINKMNAILQKQKKNN